MAVLAGCTATGGERAIPPGIAIPGPTGAHALAAFSSCSSLLSHLKREAMRVVTPYGLTDLAGSPKFAGGTAVDAVADSGGARMSASSQEATAATRAPVQGTAALGADGYSRTNVQEEGVDEPDIVKSDGRRLVTLVRGRLTVVDIAGPSPRVVGSVHLGVDDASSELLLAGDRVVVLGHGWGRTAADAVPKVSTSAMRMSSPTSTVRVVDISDSSAPTVVATMQIDGHYVSARLAGGVVRLVVTHDLKGPAFAVPEPGGDELRMLEKNRSAIRESTVTDWLPTYTVERPGRPATTSLLAPCSAVLRPQEFSGFGTVSVLTLDPADPQPTDPACVLGAGHIVYAGPENLYVATEQWTDGLGASALLHRFAIPGRQPASYVASGEVKGTVLNQFSLSELDGRLRVATTARSSTGGTESFVHVLEAQDGRLVTVGTLGNLGHEGETIQSVRFIGSRGYVVTFRQTDPLYVIDLQDPRRPQLRGELQVPGFSSYLHPLSDSVLLGVGQGPGERGGQGLQLSLFDVRDPAHPVRLANKVFENTQSVAQHDHHAFLWWPAAGRLVLPIQEYDGRPPFSGAVVVDVDPARGFGAVNRVTHEHRSGLERGFDWSIQRALVVGPHLLTQSDAGLMANDLASLVERSWLAW